MKRALDIFAVVVLVGPRQVGKSTLVQEPSLGKDRLYLTLDEVDLLGEARSEPERLLGRADRITLDEIQRAPELLLAIKREVDRRKRPGRFLVTGSADILAMKEVADHLPGRAVYLNLEPLSAAELRSAPSDSGFEDLFLSRSAQDVREKLRARAERQIDLEDLVIRGGFPEAALLEDDDARDFWFTAYVRSWLERGLTDLSRVGDIVDLKRVMQATVSRLGGLLNQAEVARDAGLPRTTAHRYLGLLSLGLLVDLLPAYSRNLSVRVIKTPKVYWKDTGLAASLTGICSRKRLNDHPLWGPLVENLVLSNLRAWASAQRRPPQISYWRTAGGREVDFVIETENCTVPVEIKATRRVRSEDIRNLEDFQAHHARRSPYGVFLHAGDSVQTPAPDIVAVPFAAVL